MYGSKLLLPIFVCLLLSSFSHAQNWEWIRTSVGSNFESVNAIAVDQTDSTVYSVGQIAGLGSYSEITVNYGNEDASVIKYDYNGNVLWAFPIGGSSKDEATGIEVDQVTGNIYVTGYVRRTGTINFSGAIAGASSTTNGGSGNNDAFIACYSKNGSLIWYKLIGGNNDDRGLDVTVNSSGVYVLGYYTASASYGSVSTVLTNTSINFFLAAYHPTTGAFLWGNEMGSSTEDFVFNNNTIHERKGCGITADNNSVYVINFFGGINYGIYHEGGNIPMALIDLNFSQEDLVVSSFTNSGIFNWATMYDNANGYCAGVDITNDCDGLYVTGSLRNNSMSPGGTTISSPTDNAFISKLDKATGSESWIRQMNSYVSNEDFFMGIHADGYGSVYAVGIMLGTNVSMEISPSVHNETGANTRETIIVKYGTNGVFKSFERLPSPNGNGGWATDIATFENKSIFIGGYYDEELSIGTLSPSQNDDNGFVARKTLELPFYYTSTAGTDTFCTNEANPLPTINTIGSGTFTAPTEIVFANSTTGLINLYACTPGGPYTITYTVTLSGCTTFSNTYEIYIAAPDDPSFSFVTSNFCLSAANPVPTVATPGGTFTSTSGLVFANPSTGEIDLTNSLIGNYTLTYTTSGNPCVGTSTFSITVESPDPTFSYSSANYCPTDANPIPSTALAGGTFTSTAGLVFVSTTTGEIDLANSTSGIYTITHTTSGICSNTATFSLTINSLDDPSFNYSANSFCQGDANPLPSSIATPGGTFSAPAGIVFVNSSTGEIDLAASTTGSPYAITYTTSGACPASDDFNLTIFEEEDPTFSYSSAAYCPTDANPIPSTALAGGTFASTAGLTFVNTTTGEIDLANSTPGMYTVTYTTPGPNCVNTATFSLTINPVYDAAFSYAANSFCQGDANPLPSSITTPGGTFSAPAGIVFVSTSTGEIDLVASTVGGPYAITYTISGACPASTDFNLTIFEEEDPTFSYSSAAYCPTDANPIPSTALAGGTFTSTAGLTFVNTTTGEIDLENSTPGTYTITHTTSGVCSNTATFTLTISPLDVVSLSYSSEFYCESDDNQVPNFSPAGGIFTGSAGLVLISSTTGEFSPSLCTLEQEHTITYTSNGVCPASEKAVVTIYTPPSAKAGDDQTLPFIFSTEMDAIAPAFGKARWYTDNSEISVENIYAAKSKIDNLPTGATEFIWEVTNGTCPAATDKVMITVEDLWIPQAITPNNDGENDFFALKSVDDVICNLQIFNRWGQIVYSSENYKNEWQGQNMKGDLQPNDTYFYVISIDGKLNYNGYVILKK